NANNFESAIFYLEKIEDKSLLLNAYHNGAIYYMNNGNFQKAKYYAEKSGNKEIVKTVTHTECVKEYNELLKKVSGVKTLDDAKRHKYVYQKMLDLAGKMGDSKLEASARETLEKI
ncbi:hypothetical protein HZC20_03455, partial [Candidatus Peregrinibacteria bacterium]|nr:hypothetical protein [Candidatus Peregrinibacteria bacterium]